MTRMKAFLAGAGAAYLLDPVQGKRRRHMLRDRAVRLLRRLGRTTGKKTRFAFGHVQGAVAETRKVVAQPEVVATDDRTVEQRIRSEAFRDVGLFDHDVDVRVEGGVATLRGTVPEPKLANDLIARVRKVPGVQDISASLAVR